MKYLFDRLSKVSSKMATQLYSTSFSMCTRMLGKQYHEPIYGIYGFIRFTDEIVDTFHEFDKPKLLDKFKKDTYEAIDEGISLNPILNSIQHVVNEYQIDRRLIETFLRSLEMDLGVAEYTRDKYEEYVLGAAYQKINFFLVGFNVIIFLNDNTGKLVKLFPHTCRSISVPVFIQL